jgi:hypothetical protein
VQFCELTQPVRLSHQRESGSAAFGRLPMAFRKAGLLVLDRATPQIVPVEIQQIEREIGEPIRAARRYRLAQSRSYGTAMLPSRTGGRP